MTIAIPVYPWPWGLETIPSYRPCHAIWYGKRMETTNLFRKMQEVSFFWRRKDKLRTAPPWEFPPNFVWHQHSLPEQQASARFDCQWQKQQCQNNVLSYRSYINYTIDRKEKRHLSENKTALIKSIGSRDLRVSRISYDLMDTKNYVRHHILIILASGTVLLCGGASEAQKMFQRLLRPRVQRKTVNERRKSSHRLFWSSLGCLNTWGVLEFIATFATRCPEAEAWLQVVILQQDICEPRPRVVTLSSCSHQTCCDLQWDAMGESINASNSIPKKWCFCWRNHHPLGAEHLWIPSFRKISTAPALHVFRAWIAAESGHDWSMLMHDGW